MIELKWKNFRKASLLIATLLVSASLIYVFAHQTEMEFHGVGVLKSADPYAEVEDTVTYIIKVYNPSDFDLHRINITDDLLEFNDTIPFMAAGNTTGAIYTLHRTVLESDPNPLVNRVSVEAIDSEGIYSTSSTEAKTTIIEQLIDITKTGPDFAHEGDPIKYTITVTNLADAAIQNVTVKDETLGFSWKGDLSIGESNMFNLTHVVPKGAQEPLTNTATVHAEHDNTTIHAEAKWTVDILHPKIDVEKTVHPTEIYKAENVTYTITTTNIGDTELFNITLTDSIYGEAPSELVPSSLLPGESFIWSFNASLHECTINVANATAVDILGMMVHDHSQAIARVKGICPRSMGYWKNHPEAWPVDEITLGNVTYSKQEALTTLWGANAKDATRMLAAQLIAAKLNRWSGVSPCFVYCDELINIDDVISEADSFLIDHPVGSNPEGENRESALWLKDILDAYNNKCD